MTLSVPAIAADTSPAFVPHPLTAAQKALIQEQIRQVLKDPDSAKFGAIAASKYQADGTVYVCGLVNAKNGFGAYTGEQPFMGTLTNDVVLTVQQFGSSGDLSGNLLVTCADDAINLPA